MYILRAKYLLTDPYNVIENGAVLIDDGKIKIAGRFEDIDKHYSYLPVRGSTSPTCMVYDQERQTGRIVDLGNSAIAPGFVNTHTHLELTHLHKCINYNGDFTDWIRQIVNAKKNWGEHEYKSSIREGIKRSLESGTTTVVDITRNGLALDELYKSKIRKMLFYELIDFNPDNAENTIDNFKIAINCISKDNLLSIGVFPHAPYTVSKELYKGCKRVSEELSIHIATHISETKDEVEFLTIGTGNFVSLLKDFDMLNNWKHPGIRPINYLNNMGILKNRCILVHCNYVSEEEIGYIEKSNSSIVFCPRSHNYFCHQNHPFRKFIENDINVALGTDSLASNDSLSILDEMKYIYKKDKDVEPHNIFYMGTIAGANALGLQNTIGRLESGFDADIAVIKLPEESIGNIYEGIFSHDSECILTAVSGTVCYDKNKLVHSLSV